MTPAPRTDVGSAPADRRVVPDADDRLDRRAAMDDLREAGDPEVDAEGERMRQRAIRQDAEADRDRRAQITDPNGVQCAEPTCGALYKVRDPANEITEKCRQCSRSTLLPVLITSCRHPKVKREKMRGCPSIDHYGDKVEGNLHVLAVQP